jgi:hypothetical protein
MNMLSPKPVIAHVVRTWRVLPGMTFSLTEDAEGRLWIAESCPAGTHFWTVAQAAELIGGARTRRALTAAIRAGRRLEQERLQPVPLDARRGRMPHATPLQREQAEKLVRQKIEARPISGARPLTLA